MSKKTLIGTLGNTILTDLTAKKNVVITSLSAMGLNTFVKEVLKVYLTSPRKFVVNLYPHETFVIETKNLESTILEKFKVNNNLDDENIYSINSLIKYLENKNSHLILVLNKLDHFNNPSSLLDYFDSFYRSGGGRISLLISGNLNLFHVVSEKNIRFGFQSYIFNGFVEGHDLFLANLTTQMEIKSLPKTISDLISTYALGHAGLIVALLNMYKENLNLNNLNSVLNSAEIRRRLSRIFEFLKSSKVDINELFHDKDRLEQLGLSKGFVIGKLFLSFYERESLEDNSLHNSLTKTETKIYQILKINNEAYLPLDQILYLLGDKYFYSMSNWALYKHLNNLTTKLKKLNIVLENKRDRGYKLT